MLGGYSPDKYKKGACSACGGMAKADFSAMVDYDRSEYSKKKQQLIRRFAKMFGEILDVKGLDKKSDDELVKYLHKAIPKDFDKKHVHKNDLRKVCSAVVDMVNSVYGKVVDTDLPEESQCNVAFDVIKSLFTANFDEFMKVNQEVNDRLGAIQELLVLMTDLRKKLKSVAAGKLGTSSAREFKAVEELAEKTIAEAERQRTILANLLNSTMVGTQSQLKYAFEKRANPLSSFYEGIQPGKGPLEFGKKLMALLNTSETVTNSIVIVKEALKEVGMTAKEYTSTNTLRELNETLHKKMVSLPKGSGAEKLSKFIDATDLLRQKFSDKKISTILMKGGAGKSEVERSLETQQKLRDRVVKDAARSLGLAFGQLVTAIDDLSERADIPIGEKTEKFYNTLKRLETGEAIEVANGDFLYAAMGFKPSQDSVSKLRNFIHILSELSKKATDAGFSEVSLAATNIQRTIDQFTRISEEIKNVKVKKGGAVHTGCSATISASTRMLAESIGRFHDMFRLSGMLKSMVRSSKHHEEYNKGYEKMLGRALGNKVNALKDEYNKAIKGYGDGDGKFTVGTKFKIQTIDYEFTDLRGHPDVSNAIVAYLKRCRDAQVKLYKAMESVDILLGAFVDNLIKDPKEIKHVRKELDMLALISEWSRVETINELRSVFDFAKIADKKPNEKREELDKLYKSISGDLTDRDVNVKYAVEMLDTTKRFICSIAAMKNVSQLFATMGSTFKGRKIVAPMGPESLTRAFNEYLSVSMWTLPSGQIKHDSVFSLREFNNNSLFDKTDKLFSECLQAMCGKVIVAISMNSVFNAGSGSGKLKYLNLNSPIRAVLGGSSAESQPDAKNVQVYYSIIRAAEFYAKLFKVKGDTDTKIITILPYDESDFGPVLSTVWYKHVNLHDEDEDKYDLIDSHQYTDTQLSSIIYTCNLAAKKFAGRDSEETAHNVLYAFVAEVNTRYAMYTRAEFSKMRKFKFERDTPSSLSAQSSSVQYQIDPDEEPYIPSPSDEFINQDDIYDLGDHDDIVDAHVDALGKLRSKMCELLKNADGRGKGTKQIYRAIRADIAEVDADSMLPVITKYVNAALTGGKAENPLIYAQMSYVVMPAIFLLHEAIQFNKLATEVPGEVKEGANVAIEMNSSEPFAKGVLRIWSQGSVMRTSGSDSYSNYPDQLPRLKSAFNSLLALYSKMRFAYTDSFKEVETRFLKPIEVLLLEMEENSTNGDAPIDKINNHLKNSKTMTEDLLISMLAISMDQPQIQAQTAGQLKDDTSGMSKEDGVTVGNYPRSLKNIHNFNRKLPVVKTNTESIYGIPVNPNGDSDGKKITITNGVPLYSFINHDILSKFNVAMADYIDLIYDESMGKVFEDAILPLTTGAFNRAVFANMGYRFPVAVPDGKKLLQSLEALEPLQFGLAFALKKMVLERAGSGSTPRYLAKLDEVSDFYKQHFNTNYQRIVHDLEQVRNMARNLKDCALGAEKTTLNSGNLVTVAPPVLAHDGATFENINVSTHLRAGAEKIDMCCTVVIDTAKRVAAAFGDAPAWGQLKVGSIAEYRAQNAGRYPPAPPFLLAFKQTTNTANYSMESQALNAVRSGVYGSQQISESVANKILLEEYNSRVISDNELDISDVKQVVDNFQSYVYKLTVYDDVPVHDDKDMAGSPEFVKNKLSAQLVVSVCTGEAAGVSSYGVDLQGSKEPGASNKKLGLQCGVFLEANIMPINVHALRRSIPFSNMYNFAYTFREVVKEEKFGNEWFNNTLMQPNKLVEGNMKRMYGLQQYIMGTMGGPVGRLRFIDRVWTDVIGGALYKNIVTEGGPPVTFGQIVESNKGILGKFINRNAAIKRSESKLFNIICTMVNFHAFIDAYIKKQDEMLKMPIAKGLNARSERMLYLRGNESSWMAAKDNIYEPRDFTSFDNNQKIDNDLDLGNYFETPGALGKPKSDNEQVRDYTAVNDALKEVRAAVTLSAAEPSVQLKMKEAVEKLTKAIKAGNFKLDVSELVRAIQLENATQVIQNDKSSSQEKENAVKIALNIADGIQQNIKNESVNKENITKHYKNILNLVDTASKTPDDKFDRLFDTTKVSAQELYDKTSSAYNTQYKNDKFDVIKNKGLPPDPKTKFKEITKEEWVVMIRDLNAIVKLGDKPTLQQYLDGKPKRPDFMRTDKKDNARAATKGSIVRVDE